MQFLLPLQIFSTCYINKADDTISLPARNSFHWNVALYGPLDDTIWPKQTNLTRGGKKYREKIPF